MKLILPLLLVLSLAFEGYEGYNTILGKLKERRMLEELREEEKVEDGRNPVLLAGLAKRANKLGDHIHGHKIWRMWDAVPPGYKMEWETKDDGNRGWLQYLARPKLGHLPGLGSSQCNKALAARLSPSKITKLLTVHNDARKATGAGMAPLTWNVNLAADAQSSANTCLLRYSPPTMCHPGNPKGMNIAFVLRIYSAEKAMKRWVDELRNYNYARNSCAEGKICGHYTQVVWADTVSVGCGIASCSMGKRVVCIYYPPSNATMELPYK